MTHSDAIYNALRSIMHIVMYGCESVHCSFGDWRDVQRTDRPCTCADEIKQRLIALSDKIMDIQNG
ncbi:MAG: hypothetical protein PHN44_07310 [Candidatus Marinimicrobia bacterium]|nr:hypothetical protein [Candidatus Neomarinimicrobiota bacterium]